VDAAKRCVAGFSLLPLIRDRGFSASLRLRENIGLLAQGHLAALHLLTRAQIRPACWFQAALSG
jgi:hypothetical protein